MPPPEPRHLFVYGTLRRNSAHPMAALLARASRLVGTGTVRGHVHDLGAWPAAVLTEEADAVIAGELLELDETRASALLALLDEYEGCSPPAPPPALFNRERTDVRLDDGRSVPAWIYTWARELPSPLTPDP